MYHVWVSVLFVIVFNLQTDLYLKIHKDYLLVEPDAGPFFANNVQWISFTEVYIEGTAYCISSKYSFFSDSLV